MTGSGPRGAGTCRLPTGGNCVTWVYVLFFGGIRQRDHEGGLQIFEKKILRKEDSLYGLIYTVLNVVVY